VTFFNPVGLVALAALVLPVLVHVLARQRAVRMPFPTLRFVAPVQAAAMRRRALDDWSLLAVRAATIACAAAAVAGPFLITAARRQHWESTVVTAEVAENGAGIGRALAWLRTQPPGRREILFRSTLPIGSLTPVDLARIPANVGIRFERSGIQPARREFAATAAIAPTDDGPARIERIGTLDGIDTSVHDASATEAADVPVTIDAPAEDRDAAAALIRRVLRDRMPAAEGRHRVRLEMSRAISHEPSAMDGAIDGEGWMGDAAADIVRSMNGRAGDLRFFAAGDTLIVATAVRAQDAGAEQLVRVAARAIAPSPAAPAQEVLAIDEARLRAWSRPSGPAVVPPEAAVAGDDRRWLWLTVIALLALETWMRGRVRTQRSIGAERPREDSRVA
jgi:aerotolerance regulator-like protein